MSGGREREQREHGHGQPPHRPTVAHILGAVFDPDPLPFIALMGLGFVIGVSGHIYKSRTAVVTGIGMIFVATLLLPLGIYLSDR
jgi:hypothetical protein